MSELSSILLRLVPSTMPLTELSEAILSAIDMEHSLLHMLSPIIIPSCSVKAVMDGPNCLEKILDMIGSATSYIHLSTMLFLNDTLGKQLIL